MDAVTTLPRRPAEPCRCARTGDLWQCAGRPELDRDPQGRRCQLGETVALTGRDRDPRGELARAIDEGDRSG